MEGERYKKSPETVINVMKSLPFSRRRPDISSSKVGQAGSGNEPEVVIFLASPDVVSGLFTLANYDREDVNGAFLPFGAGCGTIVHYPYLRRTLPSRVP